MSWSQWQWQGYNSGHYYTHYYPQPPAYQIAPVLNGNPPPQIVPARQTVVYNNCSWLVEAPTRTTTVNSVASAIPDVNAMATIARERARMMSNVVAAASSFGPRCAAVVAAFNSARDKAQRISAAAASSSVQATFVANPPSSVGTVRTAGPINATIGTTSTVNPPIAVSATRTAGISASSGTTSATIPSRSVCTSGTTSTGGISSTSAAVKSLGTTDQVSSKKDASTAADITSGAGTLFAAAISNRTATCTTSSKQDAGRACAATTSSVPVPGTVVIRNTTFNVRTKVWSKPTPLTLYKPQKAPPRILKKIYGHTLLMYVSFKLRPGFKSNLQQRIAVKFPTATAIQFSNRRDADDCNRIHLRFSSKRDAKKAKNLTRPFQFIYKEQNKFRSAWLLAIKYQYIQQPSTISPSACPSLRPGRLRLLKKINYAEEKLMLSGTSESEEEGTVPAPRTLSTVVPAGLVPWNSSAMPPPRTVPVAKTLAAPPLTRKVSVKGRLAAKSLVTKSPGQCTLSANSKPGTVPVVKAVVATSLAAKPPVLHTLKPRPPSPSISLMGDISEYGDEGEEYELSDSDDADDRVTNNTSSDYDKGSCRENTIESEHNDERDNNDDSASIDKSHNNDGIIITCEDSDNGGGSDIGGDSDSSDDGDSDCSRDKNMSSNDSDDSTGSNNDKNSDTE